MQINAVTFNNSHSVPFFLFFFLWRLPCRPQTVRELTDALPFLRPFKLESTSISTWILLSNASKASARKSLSGLALRDRCGEQMWTRPLFIGLASAKPTEKWAPFPSQQKGNRKRFKLPFLSPLPCVEDWGKEIFLTPNSYSRIRTPKKQTNYCFKTKQATAQCCVLKVLMHMESTILKASFAILQVQ